MANTRETIVVEQVGKYGPKVNGVFYSLSPKSNLRPEQFVAGRQYDVLIYTSVPSAKSAGGKKYINQIVNEGPVTTAAPVVQTALIAASPAAVTTSTATENKEAYWERKNDSQKLGGLMHDAADVTSALIMANGLKTAEALKTFDEVLAGIIAIRAKLD